MPAEGTLKDIVFGEARELGFAACGIAPADRPAPAERLRTFLARGCHAGMSYLAGNPDRRLDARSLLPSAESVICLAASCSDWPGGAGAERPIVARYARGRDYHRVLARRCRKLAEAILRHAPAARMRICVDSSPLSERSLAAAAGLGWIGRNGCLVNSTWGSHLLLAEIITDLPLEPDSPAENRCGDCRACLEACPAGAIAPDGIVDCRRCTSYLTVEHRGPISPELWPTMAGRLVGCDRCQDACPYNRQAPAGDAELTLPTPAAKATLLQVLRWSRDEWDLATRGSAMRRARYDMLLRNAAIAAAGSGDVSLLPALEELAGRSELDLAPAAARRVLRGAL